ncbi:MAG: glycosyltransferase [Bacillota bacterium]|nr:glycosyltransferase [Bacillota bacterium]
MKILIINKFLYQNGGSETYVFEVGRHLQREGHEVEYFGMEHPDRVVGNRVNAYTPNMDFHTGKLGRILYPFQIIYSKTARKKLRCVLDDFGPDVVHLNNFNFQLTPSIIYEIKKYEKDAKRRVKILYTAHDTQLVCPNHLMRIPATGELCQRCLEHGFGECMKNACIHNSKLKSLCAYLEAELYKRLKTYRYIDCIICPSHFMEKQLLTRSEFSGKTRVLNNFISFDHPPAGEVSPSEDYVIYFGRFSEEKGIGTLLKVCSSLPQISFVFAGSGPMESKVREVGNIKNVGFKKGEELFSLIQGAKFSIIPSECYENCPFSVMESISLGTPVIGSSIGGIPELIEEGETGELFSAGDEKELKKKVEALWEDKARLSRYSKACLEKKFDTAAAYCSKLIEIIEQI